MNTKNFERPFTVIYEDVHGVRKPIRRITIYDHTYEFILEGGHSVVLREVN